MHFFKKLILLIVATVEMGLASLANRPDACAVSYTANPDE